jgi:hypothetical protein
VKLAELSSVLLLLASLSLLRCNPGRVCGESRTDALQSDGGAYRCINAKDCPKRSNIFACVTDQTPEHECVQCIETRCVQISPVFCGS